MRYQLTPENTATFEAWLAPKRIRALALDEWQIAIADAEGEAWATTHAGAPALIAILAKTQTPVWAWRSANASIAISERTGTPIAELTWLRDAATAAGVVRPAARYKAPKWISALDRASGEVFAEIGGKGAASDAAAVARLMSQLESEADARTRTQVLRSCEQEQLWRHRQQEGWPLDMELLESELAAAEASRERCARKLGIDLTRIDTAVEKRRIHAWLGRVGISVQGKDGQPSLARDDYDEAVVPETAEAQERWAGFREARSVASRKAKLEELAAAECNGRIYSQISIRGTRTGRGSIKAPALQNVNRDLRGLLQAPEGHVLVSLDFDQVEPRVAAGLSGDSALIEALSADDFYTTIAKKLWGEDAFVDGIVIPERRAQAKRLIIAIFYGLGAGAIAFEFKITQTEARALLDSMWVMFPGVAAFDRQLQDVVRSGGQLRTESGRPVPAPRRGAFAALNNVVQANASDVYYDAIARVAAVLGPEALYLGVHDELVVCVPEGDEAHAREVLDREMPTLFVDVPISGTAAVLGAAWRK